MHGDTRIEITLPLLHAIKNLILISSELFKFYTILTQKLLITSLVIAYFFFSYIARKLLVEGVCKEMRHFLLHTTYIFHQITRYSKFHTQANFSCFSFILC